MSHRLRVKFCVAAFLLVFIAVGGAEAARKGPKSPVPGKDRQLYLRQGDQVIPLKQGELIFKTVLSWGDSKSGIYGIARPPLTSLAPQPLEIFWFDPETAAASLRLSRLSRVETAPAHSFDLRPTKLSADLFAQVYGLKYDSLVAINLYTAERDLPLQVSQVPGRPGWYRAVPEEPLAEGLYAVNFGLVQGPRFYAGEPRFYPFAVAPAPPAPPARRGQTALKPAGGP
jgi:hypothetical protein